MEKQILLINPSVNPHSQNRIINSIINNTFPTSLGTLAGYLASKGNNRIKIIDEQFGSISDDELPQVILSLKQPRIVGLSVLTINSQRAYRLAGLIKKIDPQAVIVVGGIHPTVLPEEALGYSGVDVVVRGEGEETFHELVKLISEGKDYKHILGISFNKDGNVIHNQNRRMIMDLNDLPPFPYHLFENDRQKYTSFGGILTSRGCPYNCIFCSSRSISGKQYRYFSIERVISEIQLLVNKYGQQTIWLMDDNLAANRQRFLDLLEAISKAKFPDYVGFHGSMRADNITDEILDKAKSVNFKMIAFGMETGCESLMKLIDKGETVKQVVDAIKKTDAKGISVATTIIFGLPGETRRDRLETVRLTRSLPLSSIRFNILTPYPGTPVYDLLNANKELFVKDGWENFAVQYMWESDGLPYVPKGNNVYELIFDTMLANLSFYLSIQGIRRMLKSSFAGGNVIKVSKGWYFSLPTLWRFMRLTKYLICRFLTVFFRMIRSKINVNKWDEYRDLGLTIKSLIVRNSANIVSSRSPLNSKVFDSYLLKVFENVLYERYVSLRRPLYTYLPFNYQRIPAFLRFKFQGFFKTANPAKYVFPAWPIEDSLEGLRGSVLANGGPLLNRSYFDKIRWPQNKEYGLVLTHDIEGKNNWKWVKAIAEIEKEMGFRSSWNVVSKFYKIDFAVLDWLVENGFEIGMHGFNHDNKLSFLSEKAIRLRIKSCKELILRYKIKGFRSPSWLRSQNLFNVLQDYFSYDLSTLDVDYISPAGRGGCCSIFPYKIGKLIELPTTLPYELPIQFGITKDRLNDFWEKKILWIKKNQGMVNVVTHPDPYYGGNHVMLDSYKRFLSRMKQDTSCATMLPGEVARLHEGIYAKTGI